MSSDSSFLVFFHGEVTLDDVERALRGTYLTVERDGDELAVHGKRGPTLYLHVSDEEHVQAEAEEFAEIHGIPEIARCTRRVEVYFDDLEEVVDEMNTLAETEMTLTEATHGWLVRTWNGLLTLPDGEQCGCDACG